ncbi:MerR family transcriptional regulator [Streptomyces sp. NPDC001941]|uniref:MerR family transcriptional regulator n=1 Tax=Streptomyces sp. NPDC001941 TaxID=3154659 RepID=UPI00331B7991
MQIGELSERSGASARSIRYYEKVGLLTSGRAGNGYREFDPSALEQIAKIKLLLQVGLDIAAIAEVLPCVESPSGPTCAHARQRFDEQIGRIERQQELLAQAKRLLHELRTEGATESAPPEAPIRTVTSNVLTSLHAV